MLVICTNNAAFEDQLVIDQSYFAIELEGESVLIVNERGYRRWYGLAGKFRLSMTPENRASFESRRDHFDAYYSM